LRVTVQVSSTEEQLLRIRLQFALHNLAQTEVAKAAGITPEALSRILLGRQGTTVETLRRVESALLTLAAERFAAGRKEQGLPERVTDPRALQVVAGLVKGGGNAS
jgi:transcriptional regulator with XRE-family HTH domain